MPSEQPKHYKPENSHTSVGFWFDVTCKDSNRPYEKGACGTFLGRGVIASNASGANPLFSTSEQEPAPNIVNHRKVVRDIFLPASERHLYSQSITAKKPVTMRLFGLFLLLIFT